MSPEEEVALEEVTKSYEIWKDCAEAVLKFNSTFLQMRFGKESWQHE